MWPLCLSFLLSHSLLFHLPHLHIVRYPSLSLSLSLLLLFVYLGVCLSLSLTFILRGCLQGCVRQALLSGLPPSSAPLSLELTMMNERERERGRRVTGGLWVRWKNEGGRDKRGTNQCERERERCYWNRMNGRMNETHTFTNMHLAGGTCSTGGSCELTLSFSLHSLFTLGGRYSEAIARMMTAWAGHLKWAGEWDKEIFFNWPSVSSEPLPTACTTSS